MAHNSITREDALARLERYSRIGYTIVRWNKDRTGFIGYNYFDDSYMILKDYTYILPDNRVCIYSTVA